MLEEIEIEKLAQFVGVAVKLKGVVEEIEDHGGILFLRINDLSGLASAIVIPDKERVFAMAQNLKQGYLVEITGVVKSCPLSAQGFLCEVEVETLAILSARTRLKNMVKIAEEE